jgi:alkanesulfonate monooxygenase SsuD/methylene tetrahydromethanopterin reductase-like flavin-dependent oxidoreductase (luciferase family)
VRAHPYGVPPPPLWVLGSGSRSQQLACDLGCAYACTLMFPGGMALAPKVLDDYRRGFAAAAAELRTCIALSVVTAESEAAAVEQNRAFVAAGMMESNVVGTAAPCAARIQAIAREHQESEVLLANWHEDPAQRIATYRRLADALQMTGRLPAPSEGQPVCEAIE